MDPSDDITAARILGVLIDAGFNVELRDDESPVVAQAPSLDVPDLLLIGEGPDVLSAVVRLAAACGVKFD